jgi:hypothetical protein
MLILNPNFNPDFFKIEKIKNSVGVYSKSGYKILSTNLNEDSNIFNTYTTQFWGECVLLFYSIKTLIIWDVTFSTIKHIQSKKFVNAYNQTNFLIESANLQKKSEIKSYITKLQKESKLLNYIPPIIEDLTQTPPLTAILKKLSISIDLLSTLKKYIKKQPIKHHTEIKIIHY